MAPVICFGELLLRLCPPNREMLSRATAFEAVFGGAEANVAASLAAFGTESEFVTRLPDNPLGDGALRSLRAAGVGTRHVLRGGTRIGIYFLEQGASIRPSRVVYDRAHSAFAEWDPEMIRWVDVLTGARWFHVTGITPALSPGCEKSVREAVHAAREIGVPVSFDLNYRRNLWPLPRAKESLRYLASTCDVLIANEEDAILMFDFERSVSDPNAGRIDEREYEQLARHIAAQCGAQTVAITLRESLSASRNGWSGLLLQGGVLHRSRRYELEVVDRVGTGDAFAAGIIYGTLQQWAGDRTVEFATAASALKHTVVGDFNPVPLDRVIAAAGGELSGRVKR